MSPTSLDRLLWQRHTLLLQGPMGPFFSLLADTLRTHGQTVWKVNFNGGDDFFYRGEEVIRFKDPMEAWPERVRGLMQQHRIDAIVLFGQSRQMHEMAIAEARSLGVTIYVFEEGYVRPDYVTLEVGGVNAHSNVPRNRDFYTSIDPDPIPLPVPTHQEFNQLAGYAMAYALARCLTHRAYPHYRHHRSLAPVKVGVKWLRGGFRKWRYRYQERDHLAELCAPERHKRWFLAPLQVYNDSQIRRHSPYRDVGQFIETVLESFAAHAPPDTWMVFKHHPLDRPYSDYTALISERADALGIADRVRYLHDQHLPTLLKHALGVVTVNSTTGLQALYHGTPVTTLGDCIYAVEGLVHPGPLDAFWGSPGTVDTALFQRFRAYLVRETQLNASFYADAPGLSSREDVNLRRATVS
jgi:capsular polysaccharide export protein